MSRPSANNTPNMGRKNLNPQINQPRGLNSMNLNQPPNYSRSPSPNINTDR